MLRNFIVFSSFVFDRMSRVSATFPRSMNTSNRGLRNRQRFQKYFVIPKPRRNLLSPAALVVSAESRFHLVAARLAGMTSTL